MSFSDLPDSDRELCKKAAAALWESYKPGRHWVGCALRTDRGEVYTGINMETFVGTAAIHAEPIAISKAIQGGDAFIQKIVTVHTPDGDDVEVISPCGGCRELIWTYAPKCSVLVNDGGQIQSQTISELLPAMPYKEPQNR